MKLLNRIHFAAAALAAVLLAAPLAHAGGIYDQYPAGPSPTGAESFAADTNLSGGRNPQTGRYTFQQLGLGAMQYAAPLTGTTVAVAAGTTNMVLDPAGTIATLTLTLPAASLLQDGQILRISSSQTVTALTVTPGSGTTVSNTPTAITISATGPYGYEFVYRAANTKWYRVQ